MSKETWIFDEVEKHSKKKKLPNVGLEVVTKIGNKLVEKKKNLAKEEDKLKTLKAEIRELEKKSQALKWLEENGHAGLIKHDVKVSFAKGEYDEADKLIKVLNKNFKNIPYDENSTVHSQTLKAFAKDQYKLGETLPEDLFNVYEASIAKVTLGKEK
jgi:hypothetical protein